MFWGMLHVVSKLPGKSIQGYLAMYPRINGQVSKDTLPSNLASCLFLISLDTFSIHKLNQWTVL